jgi:hypothetical protein
MVSVADLNGDGLPDLVVQTESEDVAPAIQTYLADKQHNYSLSGQINLPSGVPGVCLPVDVTGDEKPDLACLVTPPTGGTAYLALYPGNGDGTFASPVETAYPFFSFESEIVAAGDFNRDGHTDLVLASTQTSIDYVLTGDGAGHFNVLNAPTNLSAGIATIADVNGDGIPDLLAATGPNIAIGKGDGTFSLSQLNTNGSCVYADFEQSGRLSAACAASPANLVFLHINSDGTVNTSTPLATVTFEGSAQFGIPLQAADLNGDGILDLVLTSDDGLQVMLGKAGLAFASPVPYAAGSVYVSSLRKGFFTDMDGDGHPDFVSSGPNRVYITHGNSDGTMQTASLTETGTRLYTANTADFDGDGLPDLVTVGQPGINFLHGNGDGSFSAPVVLTLPVGFTDSFGAGKVAQILTGDFNGDQKADFLLTAGVAADNYLYLGNGDGTFANAITIPTSALPASALFTTSLRGDLNGDHKDDVVQTSQTALNAYLSQENGQLQLVSTPINNNGGLNTAAILADFNNDGHLDSVISFANQAIVLTGNGDGTFATKKTSLIIPAIQGSTLITNVVPVLTAGDFDGDGKQDVALLGTYVTPTTDYVLGGSTYEYSAAVWVYYGNGDGTFSQPLQAGLFEDMTLTGATAGAFDASGRDGLALWANSAEIGNYQDASPLILISSLADRKFSAPLYLTGGEELDSVQLADFNHDGKLDVLASNGRPDYGFYFGANTVSILLNQGSLINAALTTSPQPSFAGQSYTVTATLTPPNSQVTPLSGSIQFSVDGVAAGSSTLSGNTVSYLVASNLTAGNHAITATWAGDSTYWPVTANATQTIMDYALTSDASASVSGGQNVSINYQLQSINGFADDMTLSCSGLPAYASCSFANPSIHLAANQTVTGQISINTQQVNPANVSSADITAVPALALLLPGGLLLVLRRSRKAVLPALLLAVFAIIASGCGGSGNGNGTSTPPAHTPAGTYTITLAAKGASTQLQRSTSIKLIVSQ